jgi:hypothetical protein
MTTMRIMLLAASLLPCTFAAAQTEPAPHTNTTVYKCTAADGSVAFSGTPCADAHSTQKVVDTSAALRAGSGGNTGEITASVNDSDCRKRAQQSAHGADEAKLEESKRHVVDYQKQKSELASRKMYAPDGSGKLVDDPNVLQIIAKLDEASAKEREAQGILQARAATASADALKACDAEAAKNARDAEAAKNAQAHSEPAVK